MTGELTFPKNNTSNRDLYATEINQRMWRPEITVGMDSMSDYVCDGTADNVQLQAAATFCILSGRKLIVRAGNYDIQSSLLINGHLVMCGEGPEHTIFTAKNGLNDYIIKINSTNSGTQYRPVFRDFKVSGNCTNQSAGGGIIGYGIVEGIFHNIHGEYCYDWGLWLYDCGGGSGSFGHHNRILSCLFDSGLTSGGIGGGIYAKNNDENEIGFSELQYLKVGTWDGSGFNRWSCISYVNCITGAYQLDSSRSGYNNCVFDKCTHNGALIKGAFNILNGCTFYDCSNGNANGYSALLIDYYGCNSVIGCSFMSDVPGETKYGIEETGNAGSNTKGNNCFDGNMFYSMGGATSLTTSIWGTAPMSEASTNRKGVNYAITSAGATSL